MTILGIDAGASWIKAGLLGDGLTLKNGVQVPSGARQGVAAYQASIAAAVAQVGGAERVGLAVPGVLSRDGRVLQYAPNIAGLGQRDGTPRPVQSFAPAVGTAQLIVANDAACAALAEWHALGERGRRPASLLLLTWGTGIGSAFITEGVVHYGWEGGHLPVTWDTASAIPCGCGSVHDVEAFCAVPHLTTRANMEPAALLAAAQAGEAGPAQVIAEATKWLARGLHMMSVLVYPEVVVIGGGFMANDWLLEQVKQQVQTEGQGLLADSLRPDMLRRAQLGNDAGMIGAALLAKQRFG